MAQVTLEETTDQPPAQRPAKGASKKAARPRAPRAAAPPSLPAPAQQGPDQGALIEALREMVGKPDPIVEPEADEGALAELVRTGWVRLPGAKPGQVWRLRAPLMGEFRKLRTLHEAMYDEIERLKYDATVSQAEFSAAVADAERHLEPERSKMILDAQLKHNGVIREIVPRQEDERARWWLQVLETLCVDSGYPTSLDDELPVWTANLDLPAQVVHHWRTSPLAPGR